MRMKLALVLSTAILALGFTGNALAIPIVDQVSPNSNTSFNANSSTLNWQQEVVVGVDGLLSSVDLYTSNVGTLDFYINAGSAWQSDANDFVLSGVNMSTKGWNSIDLTAAGLLFNTGDTFVIGIQGINASTWIGGSGYPGLYTAGQLYLNGSLFADDNHDIAFQTYMDTENVPEPATLFLFGAGLAGLMGATVRRQKNNA